MTVAGRRGKDSQESPDLRMYRYIGLTLSRAPICICGVRRLLPEGSRSDTGGGLRDEAELRRGDGDGWAGQWVGGAKSRPTHGCIGI